MSEQKILSAEELKERAVRFFNRYGKDLDQIKSLLEIRLTQLALAYTIENKLPPEAIKISTRVKTLSSFLKKLEKKNWPQFYYPTEVVGDLIGARVVCWFLDDCHGYKNLITSSLHLKLDPEVEDYITTPKPSGYRSIHLDANVSYDSVKRNENLAVVISPKEMKCEIQIRTKLQDAWGDVTHDFHYKAKNSGVEDKNLEGLLSDISDRLATEDKTLIKFRQAYQRLADEKLDNKTRVGFRDESPNVTDQTFFIREPYFNLTQAKNESKATNKPVFAVIYDEKHPLNSRLEYSLGYFMEYQTTKKIVDEYFIACLVSTSTSEAKLLIPDDDPLENCRLVILSPNEEILLSEGVYANPDEGLKRVRNALDKCLHD
jgi:putative GTP pyrophosphokinase